VQQRNHVRSTELLTVGRFNFVIIIGQWNPLSRSIWSGR